MYELNFEGSPLIYLFIVRFSLPGRRVTIINKAHGGYDFKQLDHLSAFEERGPKGGEVQYCILCSNFFVFSRMEISH